MSCKRICTLYKGKDKEQIREQALIYSYWIMWSCGHKMSPLVVMWSPLMWSQNARTNFIGSANIQAASMKTMQQ